MLTLGRRQNALALLLLWAGCTGTSTGNPLGDGGDTGPDLGGGEETGGEACEEVGAREVGEDEQTELGFSARDVLMNAAGAHSETLRWQPLRVADYGPESGEQALSIAIVRTAAPVRLVDYEKKGAGEEYEYCPDLLEIEVDVSLQTAAGALAEQFTTKLRARSKEVAHISHRLDPQQLGGSFAVTELRLEEGYALELLHVDMSLTRFGISGSLTPSFERTTADSASQAAGGVLATWGLAACQGGGVAVPLAEPVAGFSGAEVVALLNANDASARWHDDSESALALAFEPATDGACAVLEESDDALYGPQGTLAITGTLRANSADGRIDASWPVRLTAHPSESGALEMIAVELDYVVNRQGWSLADYGLHGFDVSAYDYFGVGVNLAVSGAGAWSGKVEVTGYERPDCPTAPVVDENGGASSPGCPGSTPHVVASATLR